MRGLNLLLGVCLAVAMAAPAVAGNVLRLKVGDIDPLEYVQGAASGSLEEYPNPYFVVQFAKGLEEQDQLFLNRNTFRVVRYIPDNAVLVAAETDISHFPQINPRVRAVLPYLPEFKISPEFSYEDTTEVVMLLFSEHSSYKVQQHLSGAGFMMTGSADKGQRLHVDISGLARERALLDIASIPDVEYVYPYAEPESFIYEPEGADGSTYSSVADGAKTPLPLTGFESGTKILKFDVAWNRGFTGLGQIVSVADTGMDRGLLEEPHTDFVGALLSGTVMGSAADWADRNGHGTHVAGSVLGRGELSLDKALRGGAYEAGLHVQSIASRSGWGLSVPTNLNDLFKEAYEKGARVHTNSWGSTRRLGSYSVYESQADEFMWNHPDFLILFAAGNSGRDNNRDGRVDLSSVSSPAGAKNIVAVGASENYLLQGGRQKKLKSNNFPQDPLASDTYSNNSRGIAAFSSRGPTADGRIKPDVVAPGTNIVSTCSKHERARPLWGHYNPDYCYAGGTSMATPLVAGAAAVIRQSLKEVYERPSGALVKAVLLNSADDLFPGQFGFGLGQEMYKRAPNNQQGYGLVNLGNATNSDRLRVYDNQEGIKHGERLQYVVKDMQVRKVTLVYTDAPGAPSAARALVNDLDLYVRLPSGRILESESSINNIEQITLQEPVFGAEIFVKAFRVPKGKGEHFRNRVPFALVASDFPDTADGKL